MNIKLFCSCLFFLFCLSVTALPAADRPGTMEYRRIRELAKAGDVTGLNEYCETTLGKWKNSPDGVYAELMDKVGEEIASSKGKFGVMESYMLQRKYKMLALSETKHLKIRAEYHLVQGLSIGAPTKSVSMEMFVAGRKIDVAARLQFWRHILDGIDPNWKDVWVIRNNSPMPVHPGANADGTIDEERENIIRTKIKEEDVKRATQIELNGEQRDMRFFRDSVIPKMEKYVIKVYSTSPYNTVELSELLDKYKIDEVSKKRILDSVAAKTKSQ